MLESRNHISFTFVFALRFFPLIVTRTTEKLGFGPKQEASGEQGA